MGAGLKPGTHTAINHLVATLRLTLEYDGTGFRGWARQPGERTVEGVASRGARRACCPAGEGSRSPGEPTRACTPRVRSQASMPTAAPPVERLAEALNTALPDDVAVVAADEAPDGFHARFSATARSYRYVVVARRERAPLRRGGRSGGRGSVDVGALEVCAAALVGRARLHGLHAHRDPARGLHARDSRGRMGAARRRAALHRHRRLVPSAHGADARRDDARGQA